MSDRLAQWLVDRRKLLSVFTLFMIVFIGAGLSQLQFNGSHKIFFDDDNEQLLAHEKIEDVYTKTNNLMFIFELADKAVFTRETLSVVEELTNEAWLLPYSSRVDSITNFQHAEVIGDELIVSALVEGAVSINDEELAEVKYKASREESLVNRLLSDKNHSTAINVTLNMPDDPKMQGEATKDVIAVARALRDKYEENNSNIKIHLQGLSVVYAAFNESAEYDATHLFPILFVIIIAMLLILLRSAWSALVTTTVIILGVLVSEGFIGWIGYDLNQVNIMAPIIILTLAVCDCVHLLASYLHHLSLGQNKKIAMKNALRINIQPVFLTSVTTAIGFLAMNASGVPPFRELGNFAAFGVMAAFFLSIGLLPSLAIALPMKAKPINEKTQLWSSRLAEFVIARRRILLPSVLFFATLLASFISLNELNDNTVEYFNESTEFRQASNFMEENLTGFDTISYSLDSGEAGGVNEPAFLTKVEAFANWFKQQPEIVHVQTYTDTIKRLNRNLHGDDPVWDKIPESRELAAQYQLLYELSLPFGLDLNNQVDSEKRSLLLTVGVKGVKAKELIEIDARAQAWFIQHAPDLATTGTGISIMFAHVGKKNIESMLSGSMIAIILITLTLMISLDSFRFGLLSLLPNAFPAMIALGFWGLLVGEVDLGIAVIFSLTLGIVVDDTVHFFSKYMRARKLLNKSPEDAVRYAFQTVAKPLLITTVVLVAGFSILMLSNFTVNAKMGIMISATITIALIFDFLLLPALLIRFDKGEQLSPVDITEDKSNQPNRDVPMRVAAK